jgi:fused signal recognition particle receptor
VGAELFVAALPEGAPLWLGAGLALLVAVLAGTFWARQRPTAEGEAAPQLEASPERKGLGDWFFTGLARTREGLSAGLARALGGGMDEKSLEALEEVLIAADVGVKTSQRITEGLRKLHRKGATPEEARASLRKLLLEQLGTPAPIAQAPSGPTAILVVGVNGSGKTTTIGKLAGQYQREGKKVILAAGDTFRAGAIEQLKIWGERAGVAVVAHQEGADPASVIFDALNAARSRGADVVICDTAGRLQAQKPLMDELGKVMRAMGKVLPGAPHEVLLVLDATIGQNALSQARVFREVVGVTGVVLTKLDGTARGGVVVAVREEMGIPVKLVGLGEKLEDLRPFEPEAFVDALIGQPGV